MRCDDVRLLISADLDGEATPDEAALAAEHLAGCADCRAWRADAEQLEARFAEPVPVGAIPALPAAAASIPLPRRPARSPLRPLGLAAALAALVVGGITGVVLVRGGGDDGPRALPTASPSETPSGSPSAAASPSESSSPTPTPTPTSTSPAPSPTGSPSVPAPGSLAPSPTASMAAQPIVATARAGILDLELRLPSARQQGRIRATLRVTNNTDRDVTYRSPACRELVLRVNGNVVVPAPQQPGCADKDPVTHTLGPGAWHEVRLDLEAPRGEHTVDGSFDGRDPQPSPDPQASSDPTQPSPSAAPSQVQPGKVGPVSMRVT